MIRFARVILISVCAAAAAGCATVQPWDRDLMAQKKMRFVPNPSMQAVDDHVYFSKEGSTGGQEVGGGGCGCN
jgi:Domain of unknown function (DUF4266)